MTDSKRVVSAEEFRLVDAEGRLRGVISSSSTTPCFIKLFDHNGFDRIHIGIESDGKAIISLCRKNGTGAFSVAEMPDGTSGGGVYHENGIPLVEMIANSTGELSFRGTVIQNSEGEISFSTYIHPNDQQNGLNQ